MKTLFLTLNILFLSLCFNSMAASDQRSDFVTVEIVQDSCGEIFVPTAFTPNNDGVNDEFKVLGNCIQTVHLIVYDRWGEMIFESEDPSESWNGKQNGRDAEIGVYAYTYSGTRTDGTEFSGDGTVTMMR